MKREPGYYKVKLSDHFKIKKDWQHVINPDNVLDKISFVFTMKGFKGLYLKTNEPFAWELDCVQFEFDRDNGIYLKDGDMRFNHFMGNDITDSGFDAVPFIRQYLIDNDLSSIILK